MNSVLVSVLEYLGGILLNMALKALESRFPGLQDLINGIYAHAKEAADPEKAIARIIELLRAAHIL